MKERGLVRYFRRPDTPVAKALRWVSSLEGQAYRESTRKRVTELLIAAPSAVFTLPVVGLLGLAAKLEDGGSSFYVQTRVGTYGKRLSLVKIRTMHMNSDSNLRAAALADQAAFSKVDDPRNTRVGRFMRKYELDELPQLWQVVNGQLSLVDVRCLTQQTIDYLRQLHPATFDEWRTQYYSQKQGLFNLFAAENFAQREARRRHHYDLFYARKASLGLDVYILYKTGVSIYRQFRQG